MPSRLTCIAIVAFWLATLGWFIHREVLPHFRADGPPPVVIELADEAVRQPLPITWQLFRNGQLLTKARTQIKYEEDDTFTLMSTIFDFKAVKLPFNLADPIIAKSIKCTDHVTRSGRLLSRKAEIALEIEKRITTITIDGEITGGKMVSNCKVSSPWGNFETELPTVDAPPSTALNQFHPMHKFPRLRPGQTWRQSTNDPLAEALRQLIATKAKEWIGTVPNLESAAPQVLIAEVTGTTTIAWKRSTEECWIINYRGKDYHAKTWVRVSDGAVLRQEVATAGEVFTVERE